MWLTLFDQSEPVAHPYRQEEDRDRFNNKNSHCCLICKPGDKCIHGNTPGEAGCKLDP